MNEHLTELARRATEFDGVEPFNEATRMALAAREEPRVDVRIEAGPQLVAAAIAVGDAPVELVVDPRFRRGGLGHRVAASVLDEGETRFWAHGDLLPAQKLARRLGLEAERTLLVLRREGAPPVDLRVPEGVTIRTFTEADAEAVVAVNARAFASHPEQGAMDLADFRRRTQSSWFDPEGLFVAERDGEVVGFHWTKIEDGVGEVYVVGVDPSAHGAGLGTALTARGLQHLDRQVQVVDLYVEADNDPALVVYRRLGFTEHARDTLYAR
ncbi:mycothiol synthase [Aeromicrobium sp. Leaf350]|uniref:mycothiol synthase n=1 Tax=Aeromicrobium sp. Leaf350 TaxID=2876565 RepID=UPI001E5EA1DB|nr:mycothiol synthase [Aeromicrobium sp. Leaf350]